MFSSIDNLSEIKRFYILGIGRSGTTLLVNILNRHSETLATPESVFIQFFYASFKNRTSFSKTDVNAILDFIKVNEKLQPFINWDFNYKYFDALLYPLKINYDELINVILLQFIPPEKKGQNIKVLIDKNPGNSLFGEALFKLNKNSKAIIMIRDYRANILSRKEKKHWRSTNVIYNAIRWLKFNNALFRLSNKFSNRTLFIRYEDLVTDGEKTVKKITTFLDIPFSLDLLEPKTKKYKDRIKEYKYLNEKHQGILNSKIDSINMPLYKGRIDKWKTGLPINEIKHCDVICSKFGSKFNYLEYNNSIPSDQLIKFSLPFIQGYLSIIKQQVLFRVPYGIKLKRLKQIVKKVTSKKFTN
ncbi:MAG: hypothetical protein COB15_09175 [Flavobacteriales bacterium]|nr:MAG: hypothetical protein COB15_09175 [Flavobacteriales bacterium]